MDSNNMNGQQQAPQFQQQAPQTAYQQPQYQQAYQNYQQSYQQAYQQPYTQQPVYNNINVNPQIPDNYKPISPWGYLGYSILFAIPVLGLILLIVFSFSDANINRRNYARSIWCALLVGIIITIILVILATLLGISIMSYL
ncbi:MAG: hypothetical protein K6G43_03355 [Lachnospiraceae bacterium]|nr:hypothetical protein [Lachnospiraceae bacterium]